MACNTFFSLGIIFAIFLLLWTIFIYNYPKDHPWISNVERMNIEKSLDEVINFERVQFILKQEFANYEPT